MSDQGFLFDPVTPGAYGIRPTDPNVDPRDVPRLSRQCELILERLRRGPATNRELAAIALKYTGRLSDARQNGHDIRVLRRNAAGVFWYGLYVGGVMCGREPEGDG